LKSEITNLWYEKKTKNELKAKNAQKCNKIKFEYSETMMLEKKLQLIGLG